MNYKSKNKKEKELKEKELKEDEGETKEESEEDPEYYDTLEYDTSLKILERHNRFITFKKISSINKELFIKEIYENKKIKKYLEIDKLLSKNMKKNIIIEINEYLDYKEKIKLILLPEFIFKENNSPFENDKKLLEINKKSKYEFNEEDKKYIDLIILQRIIFNLYMFKLSQRMKNINKIYFFK